jgi:hypothetical protein
MLRSALLCTVLVVAACAAPKDMSAPPPALPDGRDLSEHPLDVLNLPQP